MLCRSKQLFLLVGSNPLPVFVAASLLSEPDGVIYLIHTVETSFYANNLKELLIKRSQFKPEQFRFFELKSPSDQFCIHKDLAEHLTKLNLAGFGTVGLNYTGGMKSMAVHAYEFLKEWCAKKYFPFTFSYLDPVENCLRFANGQSYHPTSQDCSLTLSELLALHGRTITQSESQAIFSEVGVMLADIVSNPGGLQKLQEWNNLFLRNVKKEQLQEYLKPFQTGTGFCPSSLFSNSDSLETFLRTSIQNTCLAIDDSSYLSSSNRSLPSVPLLGQLALAFVGTEKPNISHWDLDKLSSRLVNYLDGKWLENYVFSCLEAISDQCGIHERKLNVKFSKPAAQGKIPEFDVVAMQGYRLYAISCTVSAEREKAKLKLFEAYIRARQMGGDEAKVAFISGNLEPDDLLQDISEAWMEPRKRIMIFGPQHFRDLKTHLMEWFSGY